MKFKKENIVTSFDFTVYVIFPVTVFDTGVPVETCSARLYVSPIMRADIKLATVRGIAVISATLSLTQI